MFSHRDMSDCVMQLGSCRVTQQCVKRAGTSQQPISHTIVHGDDVQTVEQLALVLVDSLHVDVKHGRRVYFHLVLLLQVLAELHLVVLEEKSNPCDIKQVWPAPTCTVMQCTLIRLSLLCPQ